MTKSLTLFFLLAVLCNSNASAQKGRPAAKARSAEIGQSAVVLDETLSVLRDRPSLFANGIQRMRRGRKITIAGVAEADGVKFFKVNAPPANFGWVQSDAVFGKFRPTDDSRLAALVRASSGFEQIELANEFFTLFPASPSRMAVLLLYGDLLEEVAVKLSKDANRQLSRGEMAATAAPLHSYFLNYVSLDRYRKLGVVYLFNSSTKTFHYDGASWKEIVTKHSASPEAIEARKRLDLLRRKMDRKANSPVQ